MRIAVFGAGAVGGYLGVKLAAAGEDVTLIDQWPQHVDLMKRNGLTLTGTCGDHKVAVKALHLHEAQSSFICRNVSKTEFGTHGIFVGQVEQVYLRERHDPLVYMDGRLEVCSRDTFEKFERIRDAMAVADKRFELLLLDQNGQLPVVILDSRYSRRQITGLYNTPGWRLVYADRAAAVFLDEPTANRLNLPLADFTPLQYPDGKPDQ